MKAENDCVETDSTPEPVFSVWWLYYFTVVWLPTIVSLLLCNFTPLSFPLEFFIRPMIILKEPSGTLSANDWCFGSSDVTRVIQSVSFLDARNTDIILCLSLCMFKIETQHNWIDTQTKRSVWEKHFKGKQKLDLQNNFCGIKWCRLCLFYYQRFGVSVSELPPAQWR